MRLFAFRTATLAFAALTIGTAAPLRALALDPAAAEQPAPPPSSGPDPRAAEKATKQLELEATQRFLDASSEDRKRLEQEAARLRSGGS